MRKPLPICAPGKVSIPFFRNLFSVDRVLCGSSLKFKLGSGKVGPGAALLSNNILRPHPSTEGIGLADLRFENQEARIISRLCVDSQGMGAAFARRRFDGRMSGELPSPGRSLKSSIMQQRDSFAGTIGGLADGFGQNRTPPSGAKCREGSGGDSLQQQK